MTKKEFIALCAVGVCVFGLWLVWFIGNEKAAAKCGEDLQACRAAYCAKCETDYTCETYCGAFED